MIKKYLFLLISMSIISFSCEQKEFSHAKDLEKADINFYCYNFQLKDSSGVYRDLYRHLSKANILDFWASWCRPCREAANPEYKKLYKKYHNKGLNIIAVSSDRHTYYWKKALKQDSLPWINLLDSTQRVKNKYNIKSYPTMFLVDSKGKIVGKNLWGKELIYKIDSLLKKTE